MYELGLAHAIRQPEEVLLIRADSGHAAPLLFDISNVRVHSYDPGDPASSREKVARLLLQAEDMVCQTKSLLVQRAIRVLDPGALELIAGWRDSKEFWVREPAKRLYEPISTFQVSFSKMQESGMIRALVRNADSGDTLVVYRWTPFGRAVIDAIGPVSRVRTDNSPL